MTVAEPKIGSNLPGYYQRLGVPEILRNFKDLDNSQDFRTLEERIRNSRSRNFVLDFSDEEAWCGFDLAPDSLAALLKTPRPHRLQTRWINIWLPYEQPALLTALAKNYEFSPRLLAFMKSKPIFQAAKSETIKVSKLERIRHPRSRPPPFASSTVTSPVDVENVIPPMPLELPLVPPQDPDGLQAMNQYSLADEVWHWSSVDWGRRFVCLSYNSLYNTGTKKSRLGMQSEDEIRNESRDMPAGTRVWSWLLFCDDKTVITINEDPYPFRSGCLDATEKKGLTVIRRNLINVFRNCSYAHDPQTDSPILKLNMRNREHEGDEDGAHRASDTPSLLFYYLFDDWFSSYGIVFRKEHRYGAELDELRKLMLERAELAHIDRLNHIGRQLGVLKRMYQSYEALIERLLEKQELVAASSRHSHILSHTNSMAESISSSSLLFNENQNTLGASLSSAARVRFERLQHRIRLYAMSEIEECLTQKDSLVMMNFNLIAIKESYSVERLTRITLLLAKVTILFMPVSLMTGYFSCALVDVKFTSSNYWTWFGIILGVSLLGIFAFSIVMGSIEGSMIYRPMGKRIADWAREKKRRRVESKLVEEKVEDE